MRRGVNRRRSTGGGGQAVLLSGAGNTSQHTPTAVGTTVTLPKPANLADGQHLIAVLRNRTQSAVALTLPSGWVALATIPGASGVSNTVVAIKAVTDAASEPASYNFVWATSSSIVGVMAIATGLASTAVQATGTAAALAGTAPAVATFGPASGGTAGHDLVICYAGYRGGLSGTPTYTPTNCATAIGSTESWASAENCWLGSYAYDTTTTASVSATATSWAPTGRSNWLVLKGL